MQIVMLPVVLYGFGTGPCKMMEGHRLMILTLLRRNNFSRHAMWCRENGMLAKSSANNVLSNGWLFKCLVLCSGHWALNSHARGLKKQGVVGNIFS
jgi:hypothetical protein